MDPQYWKNIFIAPPPLMCQQMKRLEIVFVLPNENLDFLIQPCIVSMQQLLTILQSARILNFNKNTHKINKRYLKSYRYYDG